MDCIYLDNNATTALDPRVHARMQPYLTGFQGNASSAHRFGRRARQALEDAREQIASLLHAFPDEILFTSGATEANNLALQGLCGVAPGHLLASPLEHPSVSEPLKRLGERGFDVDYLSVGDSGQVCVEDLPQRLRPDTRLIVCMLVDHETGAIQPVKALLARTEGVAFHCDAVQAVGKLPVAFHDLGVTTLSLSAHKFHGPTGIGALLVRRGTRLPAMLHGGHQQRGMRPGTEPVALVVGLAAALDLACQEQEQRLAHVRHLRQLFLAELQHEAGPLVVNSPEGSPYALNVSFPGLTSDMLLMALDLAGIACSTGSACSSGSLLPSPVLRAMRVEDSVLRSAMRFSFSAAMEENEAREASRRICKVVSKLRQETDG